MDRRLTAILAADVVGCSRLMGANEVRTLDALKAHRNELIDGKIAEHQGRIVKLTGDGMLVEFPSVVNAVQCAAEIQRAMRERNADVPHDRRIASRATCRRLADGLKFLRFWKAASARPGRGGNGPHSCALPESAGIDWVAR